MGGPGKQLEEAGADALELNVYHVAADPSESGDAVEARYVALLAELKRAVSVPIVMKLPPFFSSLPHFVKRLEAVGADGVSLFNRFFQPDIDLDGLQSGRAAPPLVPEEALLRIRWIAILRAHTRMTLAATGGVYGADDALKLLLAGADAVHLASALLEHGPRPARPDPAGHEELDDRARVRVGRPAEGQHVPDQPPRRQPAGPPGYIRVLDSFTPRPGVWR